MKSSGKRSRFLLTARVRAPVSTPYKSARSESSMTWRSRITWMRPSIAAGLTAGDFLAGDFFCANETLKRQRIPSDHPKQRVSEQVGVVPIVKAEGDLVQIR